MLYSKVIAVCSQIHTKHISTLCGQSAPRSKHTAKRRHHHLPVITAIHMAKRVVRFVLPTTLRHGFM